MVVYLYQGGQRVPLVDPSAYIGPTKVPVQTIHAYTGGQRHLVWSRTPATLTASSDRWDRVALTWTAPGPGADSYRVYRGATQIYSGTAFAHTDTALDPSTAYTYRLEALRAGVVVGEATASRTTPALTMAPMTATAVSTSQINLAWANPGGLTSVRLRDSIGGSQTLAAGATSGTKTGLAANTSYNFAVDGVRGAQVWSNLATVSGRTQAPPPTSTGSVNGPALSSSGGWTQSTARTLNGPLFTITGYVTSFNLYIGGYGVTGSFNPWVGSTRLGWRDVPNGKAWRHVDGGNVAVSGQVRLGADAGGTGKPATAWQTYSGAAWNYNVAVGTVNYWFYTRGADGRSVQAAEPWWRPEYDGIDIHVESWVDEAGEWTRAVVHDKATGDVIGSWERE